ncbi:OmpA family protein [Hyphobacterium sp. CCMP332]|nr:OmpA family protein [Hyphobacterium sp. CCMP332]
MKVSYPSYFLIIFVISFCSTIALSQNKKEIRQIEPDAKEFFRIEEFHRALPLYIKLDSLSPNNGLYNFRIGVCYLNSYDKTRALPYFERAVRFGYEEEHLDMYLGRSYHLSQYFEKAIGYYEKYKKHLEEIDERPEELIQVTKYIEECKVGSELVKQPVKADIENLGAKMNSIYPDYVPVISADEEVLIFTSRRPNSTGGEMEFETGHYYEDIYISGKKDKEWTPPIKMPYGINTEKHDACIGLSPDGQKLFIYRSNQSSTFSGDIYVSNLKGNVWSEPERMPEPINSDGWEPSASITPDEKTIYFTSDREGGYGGTDIYMAKLLPSGEWAKPKNLGPKINTKYNEDGPFIHPDGKTLYFSSRGHKTMGGYDIFKTVLDEDSNDWSEPLNMGFPINTADDDIYYVLSADGTRAYFSSHREDTYGEKDIYVAHLPVKSIAIIQFKGHVFRDDTKEPVAATITVTDLTTQNIVGITNSNSFNGRYTTILPPRKNYAINVDLPGYLFYSENINIPEQVEYFEVSKEIYLKPLKTEGGMTTMRNIFFLPGESELRIESQIELNKLYRKLIENPEIEVEIAAHTDNQNESVVNKLLSQARAQTVMDYLVDKGIEPDRLFPVGYGDAFPIASNLTEEGRAKNRRLEIITIHGLDKGLVDNPDEHGYYYRKGITPFEEEEADVIADVKNMDYFKSKYKVGDKLDIGANVMFEFDSDKVRRAYYPVLDSAIRILKLYPKVSFELAGHTCSIGPTAYNQLLSERRVNSVVNYMSGRGIDPARLERKGYGESRPIVSNSTIQGRRKNRRVEFIISKIE